MAEDLGEELGEEFQEELGEEFGEESKEAVGTREQRLKRNVSLMSMTSYVTSLLHYPIRINSNSAAVLGGLPRNQIMVESRQRRGPCLGFKAQSRCPWLGMCVHEVERFLEFRNPHGADLGQGSDVNPIAVGLPLVDAFR